MGKIRQQHLVKSVCKLLMILVAEMKNLQAVSTAIALDDAVFIISGVTRTRIYKHEACPNMLVPTHLSNFLKPSLQCLHV